MEFNCIVYGATSLEIQVILCGETSVVILGIVLWETKCGF